MKKISACLIVLSLIFAGCGGGGGGGGGGNNNPPPDEDKTPPKTPTENTVKPGVTTASNTAPWKNETTVEPSGNQVANAKNNLTEINSILLVGIASSGKKSKTDIIEETVAGPIRGSMVYKNTYTFDELAVGDTYSYTSDTEIRYIGYEDVGFGVNGKASFYVSASQTSIGNSTYTMKGNYSISYKDATGVFAFFMTYEDVSVTVDGVETITSSYSIDGETYNSVTVYSENGDYTYTSTYTENGVTYTYTSTTIGNTTSYILTHEENGEIVIDDESTSLYYTEEIDGVIYEIYSYDYVVDGITYTYTSTTADGITTYIVSYLDENGEMVIESESTSSYYSFTVDGITTEIYTEIYVEDGITYTYTTTTVGGTTIYLTTHEENGETIVDNSSTYTYTIEDGVETEIYTESYLEDGIMYTYVSTTTNGVTTYITTHLVDGQTVIDSQSTYSSSFVNGELTETYTDTYTYEGITYVATSTTEDGVTTVVTVWTEDGVEYTDTYTY